MQLVLELQVLINLLTCGIEKLFVIAMKIVVSGGDLAQLSFHNWAEGKSSRCNPLVFFKRHNGHRVLLATKADAEVTSN